MKSSKFNKEDFCNSSIRSPLKIQLNHFQLFLPHYMISFCSRRWYFSHFFDLFDVQWTNKDFQSTSATSFNWVKGVRLVMIKENNCIDLLNEVFFVPFASTSRKILESRFHWNNDSPKLLQWSSYQSDF